jgi:hypothetical protein
MSAQTDLLITATALAAALAAAVPMRAARRRSPVAGRLATLYFGLALLLAARLVAWGWRDGAGFASVPLMLAASWLPLLTLRVAEQLVRRHAPAPVKWLGLGGAIAFSIVALAAGAFWGTAVLVALAVYQALMTGLIVRLLLRPGDLGPAEARAARIFAAALLLAIPLVATDFRFVAELPVRGGAFAVLLLVLATSRLASGAASVMLLLVDVALILAGAGITALGGAIVWPGSGMEDLIRIGAVGGAAVALALIFQRRGEALLLARARPSIIASLADLPDGVDSATLLTAHPMLAAGRLVEGDGLAPYPQALVRALTERRVITSEEGGDAGEAARDLLEANAATHLLRLSANPPRFLAISAGALGGDTLNAELDAMVRIFEGAR